MRIRVVCIAAFAISVASRPLGADVDHDLVVIVDPHNHAKVSAASLEAMFLRKDRRWPDGVAVLPLNLASESIRRHEFDRVVLAMEPDDVARYWLDQRIRDGTSAPREIVDPATVVKLVAHLDGAIGYVPASTELVGVVVVARIRHGTLNLP